MSNFRVTGADDFLKLSRALKAAGEGGLRKELAKGLRDGAKPLIGLTRAAAESQLPHRGGLAAQVAKAPQRVQTRTGADPGVRILAGKAGSGARGADNGSVRHPVFGRPGVFAVTQVRPGWFSKTIEDNVNAVMPAMERAVDKVIQEVIRRG